MPTYTARFIEVRDFEVEFEAEEGLNQSQLEEIAFDKFHDGEFDKEYEETESFDIQIDWVEEGPSRRRKAPSGT